MTKEQFEKIEKIRNKIAIIKLGTSFLRNGPSRSSDNCYLRELDKIYNALKEASIKDEVINLLNEKRIKLEKEFESM